MTAPMAPPVPIPPIGPSGPVGAAFLPGSVTLVGAGPGDPELLTLKAVRAIAAATVLLVDDLVGSGVLAYASPTARIVHVGKRGGCKSTQQAWIEQLMIASARAGEIVVRLKGGDPFIFGRGGEEVQCLQEAGIAFGVVNGITAGLAGLSSLGVPLTHRDHAHGVVLVTGHAKGAGAGTDWQALGAAARHARLTLVIYMGVSAAEHIQRELLCHLCAHTPLAIIQHASLPQQRHAITTLGAMHATLQNEGLGSPAVMVVGHVLNGFFALERRAVASGAQTDFTHDAHL